MGLATWCSSALNAEWKGTRSPKLHNLIATFGCSRKANKHGKYNKFELLKGWYQANPILQTALFSFQSALLVLLLLICTSAYVHQLFPGIMDRNKDGYATELIIVGDISLTGHSVVVGVFWKSARVGERLSPYISVCCILYAVCLSLQYTSIY